MNVVDSSGWLEYFADGRGSEYFAVAIEDTKRLIVPVITIYEVFKRILSQRSEDEALAAIGVMVQGVVVDVNTSLALKAAELSVQLKLPMADSIILATAKLHGAVLWTQDAHFENLEGVRYQSKQ